MPVAPIKSSSWHIFLIDPTNRQTVWISRSYAWREALTELGRCCKVLAIGYSEADEMTSAV